MSQVKTLLSETLAAAKKHGVVPDVLDAFENSAALRVVYDGREAANGAELTPAETQALPRVEVSAERVAEGPYTLLVTDPDAPRRGDPKWSEFAHYLVTDIRLDPARAGSFQPIDFAKARELLSYMGPGPPPKTALHRYVFLLLEGATSKEVADRPNWGFGRPGAGFRDWLQGQDLRPVGLQFFEAQNTEQE